MRRALALAAIAALGLTGATVAVAGKKLKTKSATQTVPADELGTVEAKCSRGTRAVAGGFEAEFEEGAPFLEVNRSAASGKRRWASEAFNDGMEAGDLTSFAYCRDVKRLTTATRTVPAPVGDFVTATAECPAGTKLLAGGFAASPSDAVGTTPVLYISESRRVSKRGWEVSAFSNGNEDGELTSVARCGRTKKLKQRSDSGVVSTLIPDAFTAELLARCKRKERVIGGGFGTPDDGGMDTPRFLTSRKQGKRAWAVTSIVGNVGLTRDVTAYAYCEKK